MREELSRKLAGIQKRIDDAVWKESDFADMLKQPSVKVLLKEKEAYLLYMENGEDAEILMLGVVPEKRRQGIAARLLKEMLEKTESKYVFLEVNEKNEPAIRLYEKHGFKQIAKRPKYYGKADDALVLKRENR